MKIIKRSAQDIAKEEAHGGSGARKVYVAPEHTISMYYEHEMVFVRVKV